MFHCASVEVIVHGFSDGTNALWMWLWLPTCTIVVGLMKHLYEQSNFKVNYPDTSVFRLDHSQKTAEAFHMELVFSLEKLL